MVKVFVVSLAISTEKILHGWRKGGSGAVCNHAAVAIGGLGSSGNSIM